MAPVALALKLRCQVRSRPLAEGKLVHGTAVAINGYGVLITGQAGSGKSDLALRLIDRCALLIADDSVNVMLDGDEAVLSCMPNIEGKMEVRNLGILDFDTVTSAPLTLCVVLDKDAKRYPDENSTIEIAGANVHKILLNPFETSAAIKVELALDGVKGHGATNAHA